MKLQSTNGTTTGSSTGSGSGKSASGKGATEYNADGTKKIPKDVQEFGEDLKSPGHGRQKRKRP